MLRALIQRFRRPHRPARSFLGALESAGGMVSRVDRGIKDVPVEKIVGSVGRWQNLRSDFLYRTGQAMTQRFYRVGQAMAAGKMLPPLELYKLRWPRGASGGAPPSEYYVVDGHHRVAMARRLGQDYLDAHVIEYTTAEMPAPADDARLAHALRRVQLFRDAPASDLQTVWRHLSEAQVRAGSVICRRGDPGDRFYIVRSGSVEVRLGTGQAGVLLYRLGPGDCFGEMSLLMDAVRSADVVALEDSVLWALERTDFDRILNSSIPLLRALNRSLAKRLAMATDVIEQSELVGPRVGAAGLRFGQYRVLAQIGMGGMAVVYSAARESDGLAVALKVLPVSWGSVPDLRARLYRESTILRQIRHPGVIQVLDVGSVAERLGGGTYIVMEWLPDGLDRALRAQYPAPLAPDRAVAVAAAVADALAAVHAAGLVHRDVKPSNILLRANGEPVLTDFGLAAALAEIMGEQRLTPPNQLLGTADYLAPESIAGTGVDGRADLYALGIVLYEMLTGLVPFAGRDPVDTLRAHREEPVPPLPETIPLNVRAVVTRALHKQPQDRYAAAAEMAAALREAHA
jgi:CRP-like cAMP-binding protein